MKKKKLYYVNDNIRYYNIYNVSEIDLFCSELSIFCNNWIRDGGNLFFIKSLPNNNISLTKQEMNFIYLLDQNCKNFEYLDYNNKINNLMENQKNDLLLFDLEKINFLFLIPEFNNSCYYFNLFISFKDESMSKNLFNLNFNLIRIDCINKIKNLSFLDVKNIFNFDKSKFSDNKFDYRFVKTLNIDCEKKKINIKPVTEEEQQRRIINFLTDSGKYNGINENEKLKLEIREILSNYLKKPDINYRYNLLKRISYFFYWNINVPDHWSDPDKPGYEFVLDDETGYSIYYAFRISIFCKDFKLNTLLV